MTEPASRARMPVPRTSLIGRDDELRFIERFFAARSGPLLTLTGPGGVGKTRLAIEAASQLAGHRADGVLFVPLSEVTSGREIAAAILAASGASPDPSIDAPVALDGRLEGRELLLVLDNLEQVRDAAPVVSALLDRHPRLTVLATSRAPLHIYGECELPVRPLSIARAGGSETGSIAPAWQLFEQRARAADPSFVLGPETEPDVEAVCRALDGLPLAIELTAPRIRTVGLRGLREMLEARAGGSLLDASGRGPDDRESRQRTLRSAIAWSYDLLPPEEQAVFRALSVAAGGFTLELAGAVCAVANPPRLLAVVETLVEQSLVLFVARPGAEPRWTMLSTIREFARERLDDSGDGDAARRRFAAAMAGFAEAHGPALQTTARATAFAALDAERANLAAALTWTLSSEDQQTARHGIRIVNALWVWFRNRDVAGGRAWAERACELADAIGDDGLSAGAHFTAGHLALAQGDANAARTRLETSVRLWRGRTEAAHELALALSYLSLATADASRAGAMAQESLAVSERIRDGHGAAWARYVLGVALERGGDATAARSAFQAAATTFRTLGESWLLALPLVALARVAVAHASAGEAAPLLAEALALFEANGDSLQAGRTQLAIGRVAALNGESEPAVRACAAAVASAATIGDRQTAREALEELAGLARTAGNLDLAARLLTAPDGPPAVTLADEAEAVLCRPEAGPAGSPAPIAGLSPRELEVLSLLATGMRDAEIAARLVISPSTVHRHMNNIFAKLGVSNRVEAAAVAHRHGPIHDSRSFPGRTISD